MKLLTSIIAIIGILITIALTIMPIGMLTAIPALITVLCGIILLKLYKKEGSNTMFPKVIIGLAIIGALVSSSRALLTSDKIAEDQKFEQRQKDSNKDAVEDLEGLE